ncbi:unnamed protein product, partial [Rotaria sordida]
MAIIRRKPSFTMAIIRCERRKMNANNEDHHDHEVVINSDHNHSKASIMPIDRPKYIYHDGEFLPIDYIL